MKKLDYCFDHNIKVFGFVVLESPLVNFKMVKQEVLLGCSYQEDELVLKLLALASHENFFCDLKTNL